MRGVQRQSGFRITIFDERSRGDSSKPRLERVVVGGTPHCLMLACRRQMIPAPARIFSPRCARTSWRSIVVWQEILALDGNRVCQAFFRISITVFASSSESTAA